MKRKVLSVVLAAAMVFSMAACGNNDAGNEGNSGNSGSDVNTPTAAPSSDNGGGSSAEATPAPTEDPRSEGEKLADQYNGFVETPMDLNGRTIRIAASVGTRYNYAKDANGNDDPDNTNEATIEIVKIMEQIEADYNCKFEIIPSMKGKDIVQNLYMGMTSGEAYCDILDEGVSDTYLDQIMDMKMVMPLDDPQIADIIKLDTNPWTAQSDYGIFQGTQYAVNFVTNNSSNILRNALLFNIELAEQYGLGDLYSMVKDGTWTWAKFEEMCETITKQSDGSVVPAGYGKENLLFPMTVFSNGGTIANLVDGHHVYTGTDERTLEAGQWIYDLREKGYLAPNWTVKVDDGNGGTKNVLVEGGIDVAGFAAGQCVFYFDFYGDLQKLTQGTQETSYTFGLLPHPLGPYYSDQGADVCKENYHGVTYSADMKMIVAGVEKPEEVAAVLVAIANRTSKPADKVLEVEMRDTLGDEESGDMLMIMYNDMRSDYSRMFTGHKIGSISNWILKLEKTPMQAFEEVASETQLLYDGTETHYKVTFE